MDMKRFFLYAISIAALALAGCGGGGGGGMVVNGGNGNGGNGPMECPEGQENYPACTPIAPPPSACTLVVRLECTEASVAQPIADPDKMDGPGGNLTGYSLSIPAIMAVAGGEVKVDGNADADVDDAVDDTLAKDDMDVANRRRIRGDGLCASRARRLCRQRPPAHHGRGQGDRHAHCVFRRQAECRPSVPDVLFKRE